MKKSQISRSNAEMQPLSKNL